MILRNAVYKLGIQKNARVLKDHLVREMGNKYENPLISLTKTKLLLKKYCGLSHKKDVLINHYKLTESNKNFR